VADGYVLWRPTMATYAPEHTLYQICHQSFRRRARCHHRTLFIEPKGKFQWKIVWPKSTFGSEGRECKCWRKKIACHFREFSLWAQGLAIVESPNPTVGLSHFYRGRLASLSRIIYMSNIHIFIWYTYLSDDAPSMAVPKKQRVNAEQPKPQQPIRLSWPRAIQTTPAHLHWCRANPPNP